MLKRKREYSIQNVHTYIIDQTIINNEKNVETTSRGSIKSISIGYVVEFIADTSHGEYNKITDGKRLGIVLAMNSMPSR